MAKTSTKKAQAKKAVAKTAPAKKAPVDVEARVALLALRDLVRALPPNIMTSNVTPKCHRFCALAETLETREVRDAARS